MPFQTKKQIFLTALLDSRPVGNFVGKTFVKLHFIPLILKEKLVYILIIDGQSYASRVVTYENISILVKVKLYVVSFNGIGSSFHSPIILGLLRLTEFNPSIHWKFKTLF